MLIDWFTVVAQALNFLILVWLMKHFLYKPILHAIDAREKRIAAELADASSTQAEARRERDEFQHKNEEFDQERVALFGRAKDEANAERQRLLDEARRDSDALRDKRQDALRRELQRLKNDITRRTQEEVFAIARKTLADLSGTSLEERISDVFTQRLLDLDSKTKQRVAEAFAGLPGGALVRCAFDLPAEQQNAIQDALNETFATQVQIRFEAAPDLIGGIELVANGQKLAWSIGSYLASLESSVGELLHEEPGSRSKPHFENGQAE
jgi:F-type H+-transporting ATPase subunit b